MAHYQYQTLTLHLFSSNLNVQSINLVVLKLFRIDRKVLFIITANQINIWVSCTVI